MSFFVREQTVSKKTKKFSAVNNNTKRKKQVDQDEEIESEDEINGKHHTFNEISDEEDLETPEAKRLRLAKQYLEDIKKSDDEEEDVSKKLKLEYLESIGKLKKYIAETIVEYDSLNIGTLKHKLQKQSITCLCLSPDDNVLFSGSKTGFVLKWDLGEKRPKGSIDCSKYHGTEKFNSSVMCLALTSDSKFLALGDNSNLILICDPQTMTHLHTFEGHRDAVSGLVFRRETHQLYSCSKDRSIKIWSLDEMAYVETLYGHQSPITSIDALSKERALTSGGVDQSLRIWKIVDESQLIYNGHKGSIDCVKFINEDLFLSCGDDGSLCLWNANKKKPTSEITLAHGKAVTGEPNWISAITTLVNSDIIASGSRDGYIRIWKLERNNREIKFKFEIPVYGFVNALAFTNDGSFLIAGIGQEHRLGRWWRLKESKNNILIIPMTKKS